MLSTLNIPCDGKQCGQGRHVGGGNYICPHRNLKVLHPEICQDQACLAFDCCSNQKMGSIKFSFS